ncbi:hypothetical protein [Chamaesiphon sp. VAR_48_metabat_403]|uniref:hypothetical protein n=1 Tax=Chamaesiphon sp. VAR_48_metabat_403 TaxID=2964700 RepID=UPI00286E9BE3|nr:hypothetical protein [Chamaesiphon sp. VAR_48_metabat_403]
MENPTQFLAEIRHFLELFADLYSISATPDPEPDVTISELYSSDDKAIERHHRPAAGVIWKNLDR